MRRSILAAINAIAMCALFASCEDSPLTPFEPEYVVQGFLIVGEPIGGITVARSLAVIDTFDAPTSAVSNARVQIVVDDTAYTLAYRADTSLGEYYLPDSSVRVRPATIYRINITTADGAAMTAATLTPEQIEWIRRPADTVVYPVDREKTPLSDSMRIAWTTVPRVTQYLLRQVTLDTINYGIYLTPPTSDSNTMVPDRTRGRDLVRWSIAPATNMTAPFSVFRWHGPHEITVFAPEENLLDWFRLTLLQQQPHYDPLLGNMEGALGTFGSASILRTFVFVKKAS